MKVIIIDAGHGGHDPGASGYGYVEKNEALKDSKELQKIIESKYEGVKVIQIRTSDNFVSINDRRKITNDIAKKYGEENVIFISLHWNSYNSTTSGWEIWANYPNTKGDTLAKAIEKEVRPILNIPNRKIKYAKGGLGVLTSKPATALIEACFISNKNDINAYIKNRTKVLTAYAKGIANYLKLKEKTVVTGTLYKVQLGAYSIRENADKLLNELKEKGFNGFIRLPEKDNLYRVQTGAYSIRSNADKLLDELDKKGFKGFIVVEETEKYPIAADKKSVGFQIGDAKIIKTTPDNIYIPVLGDNLFKGGFYGVNGTFFDTTIASVSSPNACIYIAVNNGKALSGNSQFNGWKAPPRGTIHYSKSGNLGNRRVKSINELPKDTDWAIGGATIKPYMQLKDENIPTSISYKTSHTYVGYDEKGYIYLIVKPNHRPSEIVPTLDNLGIKQCIMIDGGGSSQLNYSNLRHYSSRKINTAVLLKKE